MQMHNIVVWSFVLPEFFPTSSCLQVSFHPTLEEHVVSGVLDACISMYFPIFHCISRVL